MNVSEGRRRAVIDGLAAAAGSGLLDLHADAYHHRSVLTLAGPGVEDAVRAVSRLAVEHLDLRHHDGVHPRLGVVDVVPFVPLTGSSMADAIRARDEFATWARAELGLPCGRYGPDTVSLPELRRLLRSSEVHPTAGLSCVGARPVLVAYNLWMADLEVADARLLAGELRGPAVRALALPVGGAVQLSFNLVAPETVGPAWVYDAVSERAVIQRAELVGLVPRSVLEAVPVERWEQLDLDKGRTIEARLARNGLTPEPDDGGGR